MRRTALFVVVGCMGWSPSIAAQDVGNEIQAIAPATTIPENGRILVETRERVLRAMLARPAGGVPLVVVERRPTDAGRTVFEVHFPALVRGEEISVAFDGRDTVDGRRFTVVAADDERPVIDDPPTVSAHTETRSDVFGTPGGSETTLNVAVRSVDDAALYEINVRNENDTVVANTVWVHRPNLVFPVTVRGGPRSFCVDVIAEDAAGNRSLPSPPACIDVADGGCQSVAPTSAAFGGILLTFWGLFRGRHRRR